MSQLNLTAIEESRYCYAPYNIAGGGYWHVLPLYNYALPVMLSQMFVVVVASRGLTYLLKPFHQPRVVAEMLVGVLLGPNVIGRIQLGLGSDGKLMTMGDVFFPPKSYRQIETMGLLGLLYFLFLVGIDFEVRVLFAMKKMVAMLAIANVSLPFVVTILTGQVTGLQPPEHVHYWTYIIFVGASMAVTAFSVLIRMLAELKVLNTDVGQLVLPAAVLADAVAWVFLVVTTVLPTYGDSLPTHVKTDDEPMPLASLWVLLSSAAFLLVCYFVLRPMMRWRVARTPEGQPVSDSLVTIVATGVLAAAIVTDAIGINAVFGAFVLGLAVPPGLLALGLREKLQDLVVSILLPVFYASTGFETNMFLVTFKSKEDLHVFISLFLIMLLSFAVKLGISTLIGQYYSMPAPKGLSLGLLMSTKGPIEMVIFNIGKHKKIFDVRTYTILVIGSILTTAAIAPSVSILNKSSRIRIVYKRRNLQRCRPDMELRVLASVYNPRNVPSIISLLQMSNPTKRSPIFVYALHLIELAVRASAMLIVHETGKDQNQWQGNSSTSGATGTEQSEQIIAAFENYQQHAGGVSIQPLTASSPYSTMHEDIFNNAEERHATLIILPFHKLQTAAGEFEDTNPAIRGVNRNVQANAPCSVGILVDRGLGGASRFSTDQLARHHVAVLFFGGPDDREALAYSSRVAEHPVISLTVVRFVLGDEAMVPPSPASCASGEQPVSGTTIEEFDLQRRLDDECVNQFRLRYVSDATVMYTEKVVNNSQDTVAAVRAMNTAHSLYVVGKGQGMESSPMLVGLTEWTEYPELGPIGDMLVSADFGEPVSVLVLQQYVLTEDAAGGMMEAAAGTSTAPDSPRMPVQRLLNYANNLKPRMSAFNVGSSGVV